VNTAAWELPHEVEMPTTMRFLYVVHQGDESWKNGANYTLLVCAESAEEAASVRPTKPEFWSPARVTTRCVGIAENWFSSGIVLESFKRGSPGWIV